MDEKNNKWIAIIMIVVLVAAAAVLAWVNAGRKARSLAEYEAALLLENEKAAALNSAELERQNLTDAAAARLEQIVDEYIPGVVFYSDSMTETGSGAYYASVFRSLILNVYDIPVYVVNVLTATEKDYEQYKDCLPVVFIGTDGKWDGNITTLTARQRELIGEHERYIITGIPLGDSASMAFTELEMENEYGDKYINLREYFCTDGVESLGLPLTDEDRAAMEKGSTPPTLMDSNGVNLNSNGYKLAAFLTFDRMTNLGYFDEVLEATEAMKN